MTVASATRPGRAPARSASGVDGLAPQAAGVARVVAAMRERPSETLTLDDMSRMAYLSRYHFSRTFRRVTGVSPFRFLAALRMAEAKRLLLMTELSVTQVCLEIGYLSLGTFTSHFTEMVGVPPRAFRRLPELFEEESLAALAAAGCASAGDGELVEVPLEVRLPARWDAPVFVAAFDAQLPRGAPLACQVVTGPGCCRLPVRHGGGCRIFAASFARAAEPLDYLLPNSENLLVGRALAPRAGEGAGATLIELRSPGPLDPPIVVALPHLLWRAVRGQLHDAVA